VDKTSYFPLLLAEGGIIFCARPRRFGKTLTVTTLDDYYSGRKDLFQGLEAEKYLSSPDFVPRPVIHLDMSEPAGRASIESLQESIMTMLENNAARHEVSISKKEPSNAFAALIDDIFVASGNKKIVLLIDEYDAPVLKLVQKTKSDRDEKLIADTRNTMQTFYSQIKAREKKLYFTFITGVTKFSKMGVFSTLNNLVDISLDPKFGAFMGYTHQELEANFVSYLGIIAEINKISVGELLEKMRHYYDGFSFDGETKLYNPFSLQFFFSYGEFDNYWVTSGSSSIIENLLRDEKLTVEQFEGVKVTRNFAREPGEIDQTPPEGFLYQAGYLTLRKTDDRFCLEYPNFEVRASLSKFFMNNLLASPTKVDDVAKEITEFFKDKDVENIVTNFKSMFSAIPYDDHAGAVPKEISKGTKGAVIKSLTQALIDSTDEAEKVKFKALLDQLVDRSFSDAMLEKLREGYYRCALLTYLFGAGLDPIAEPHNNLGRSDIIIKISDMVYIFELKTAENREKVMRAAMDGMAQIKEKGYGDQHKNAILISLAVDKRARNIGACVYEKDGEVVAK
jgi:hypothetical protein